MKFSTLRISLGLLTAPILATSVMADYKDDIGFTILSASVGGSLADGTSVSVSQVEAPEGGANYRPNTGHAEFTGKSFTDKSLVGGTASGHATTVGRYFYGSSSSLTPGITTIHNYEANNWLGAGALKTGEGTTPPNKPIVETSDVQNHSWIGSVSGFDTEILRRLDYAINRDNTVAVMGLNNGSGTTIPSLLGSSYNGMVVGLTDGNHSRGTTTIDGAGRVRPDIVAPGTPDGAFTSFATPLVGSASALLIDEARSSGFTGAENSEVVKALVMAGATKDEFGGAWDRTHIRPLDDVYGAGELNINNSYNTLIVGEQEASNSETRGTTGWDFGQSIDGELLYFFDVAEGTILSELSVLLTWNRAIDNSFNSTLANLDLRFYTATSFTLGTELDWSISTVDNVEHIYLTDLVEGRYVIQVSGTEEVDYGLAWRSASTVVPEPASILLILLAVPLLLSRKRR